MQAAVEARRSALSKIAKPKLEDYLAHSDKRTLNLVASFQRAMVDDLVGRSLAAADACDVATLFVTGGVAANQELITQFRAGPLPTNLEPSEVQRALEAGDLREFARLARAARAAG